MVRYADDFVVGFQHKREAENFLRDLTLRLKKFSLELPSREDPPYRVWTVRTCHKEHQKS